MARTKPKQCNQPAPPFWRGRTPLRCVRAEHHVDHPLFGSRATGRSASLERDQHVTESGRVWPYGTVNAEYGEYPRAPGEGGGG